jgi:hypothetical protein
LHARIAEGLYHLLRGEPTRAVELLAENPEYAQPNGHVGWLAVQGQLAHAYNAAGQHANARRTCGRALEQISEPDRDFVVFTLDLDLQHAIADAALGNAAAATLRLDALNERIRDRGPVSRARLHEATARVALLGGDRARALDALRDMERAARSTAHPALVAQWRRVHREMSPVVRPKTLRPPRPPLDAFRPAKTTLAAVRLSLPGRRGPAEEEFTATETQAGSLGTEANVSLESESSSPRSPATR